MAYLKQSGGGAQRVLFALFCLMIIFAGSIFVLDQGQSLNHDTPFVSDWVSRSPTHQPDSVGQTKAIDVAETPTPAKLLHTYRGNPEVELDALVSRVVTSFADGTRGGAIESYLIWAISAQKSDAYIDSLLNSAAARGHFVIPDALLTLSGRLDTPSLLTAVALAAQQAGQLPRPAPYAAQHHFLQQTDSLAGLSLMYYGHPLDHSRIAHANGAVSHMAEARVGQLLEIPGL